MGEGGGESISAITVVAAVAAVVATDRRIRQGKRHGGGGGLSNEGGHDPSWGATRTPGNSIHICWHRHACTGREGGGMEVGVANARRQRVPDG